MSVFVSKTTNWLFVWICLTCFSSISAYADEQSAGAQAAAATVKTLTANPELEKKISADVNKGWESMFAHDHQSVVALPPDILFYTQNFAHQAFLVKDFVIPLDPAIAAINVQIERVLKFDYNPDDPFVKKYGLDHLTPRQHQIFEDSLSALPVIFRQDKMPMPLHVHYDCRLTLYLNNADPRVKALKLPDREIWWGTDDLIKQMLAPIQIYQVTAAQDPDLKQAPHNEANQLIANYYGYLQKNLNAPQAGLVRSKQDWGSKDPAKQVMINYDSQFLNFFPGINYLSFKVPHCEILDNSHNQDGIWLFVQNNQTAAAGLNGFSAFHIPAAVTSSKSLQITQEWNQRST